VEKAWSADIGATLTWTTKSTTGWVDAAAFARTSDDLVAFRRSSLGYVRPYNVGQARFFGGEISAEGTFVRHLRARTDVSLLDPRDVSESSLQNDLIPFRSQLTASQELEVFTQDMGRILSYLGLTAYLTYRSGRVADPAGLIVIPEQVVVDMAARAEVMHRLAVRLRAENLLQAARFDALGFPLPGRTVFLSAEVRTGQ